ncbi:MAG: type II toxin-antitoxin system RelE/ParE family toxin [Tepidisphaerales bacterium]
MRLIFHKDAVAEIEEASAWYGRVSGELADRFLAELDAALDKIESTPMQFPELLVTRRGRSFRRYRLDQFPYAVVYRVHDVVVEVVAIAHAARKPGYWSRRAR